MVPLRFRSFLMRWTDFWLKFDNEKLFHWFETVAYSTLGHTYCDWSDPRHDQRFLCPRIPGASSMKSSALILFLVLYRNESIINEVRSLRCLTHKLVYSHYNSSQLVCQYGCLASVPVRLAWRRNQRRICRRWRLLWWWGLLLLLLTCIGSMGWSTLSSVVTIIGGSGGLWLTKGVVEVNNLLCQWDEGVEVVVSNTLGPRYQGST